MSLSTPFAEVPALAGNSPAEVASRQARMPSILGAPLDFGRLVGRLSVGIIGVGAVGAAAATDLARMGVKAITFIDPKLFKPESILTQPIGPDAIGQPKARYLARVCKAISPGTRVREFVGRIEDIEPEDLSGIDVFLLATDNLSAEAHAGQMALRLSRPLLQGSVHGSTLVAQVRTFENRDGRGSCPACGFSETEWSLMAADVTFACDAGSLAAKAPRTAGSAPTISIPSLCGLAGNLLVIQLLKLVGGFGQPVADTLFQFAGHLGSTVSSPLRRKPDCRCDHNPWDFRSASGSIETTSLAGVIGLAGFPPTAEDHPALVEVEGHDWLEFLECPGGHQIDFHRFIPANKAPPRINCPVCGGPSHISAMSRHGSVSASSAGQAFEIPLGEIGVSGATWARIRSSDRVVSLRFECQPQP